MRRLGSIVVVSLAGVLLLVISAVTASTGQQAAEDATSEARASRDALAEQNAALREGVARSQSCIVSILLLTPAERSSLTATEVEALCPPLPDLPDLDGAVAEELPDPTTAPTTTATTTTSPTRSSSPPPTTSPRPGPTTTSPSTTTTTTTAPAPTTTLPPPTAPGCVGTIVVFCPER